MELIDTEYIKIDVKTIKQKCYIFELGENNEEIGLVSEVYLNSAPNVEETIIIWKNEKFTNYIVKDRKLGVNANSKIGVWNLYVKKIH